MPKYIKPKKNFKKISEWFSHYLIREGYHLDYTIESLYEIDRFFESSLNLIFDDESMDYSKAISVYIGDVFVINYKGRWNIKYYDNNDVDYKNTSIVLKNKSEVNPFSIVTSLIKGDYKIVDYIKGI